MLGPLLDGSRPFKRKSMSIPVLKKEDYETRLRRLHMRSWRRGMKEMDLILGNFADTALQFLDLSELDLHEALMNEPDQDLYAWLSGSSPAPDVYQPAVERILANMSKISSKVL